MFVSENKQTNRLSVLKMLHVFITVGLFYIAWLLFRYGMLSGMNKYGFRYNYYIAAAYLILVIMFNRTYDSFRFGYNRIRTLVFGQFLSQFFSLCIIYVLVSVGWRKLNAPWAFLSMLAAQLLIDIIWSYYASFLFFRLNPRRKTLLIYRNELDKKRFGNITGKPLERLYEITDELQHDGSFSEIADKLAGYDAVFVAGVNSRCRNGVLKYCKENCIHGLFLPHVGDIIMQEAEHVRSFDSPVLYANRKYLSPENALLKRAFDLFFSGLALIILSPIMLITGLAIHFYDGGPAFYRQTRLTKDGREFKILKFRSMRVDAEKDGVARLSTGDKDDRITPIGRVVRKFRIDEIPQFWNIFVGDMSIVGPRPERPEIAEQYYEKMPDFRLRLQVKAGLTGYAQIYGKYNTDPYEKLEFDLLYIKNMSFLTDLQLCFATFSILLKSESTEGIKEGTLTALQEIDPKELEERESH